MFDILLFAILAAFLIYRLYDVLGTGDEDNDQQTGREWSDHFNDVEEKPEDKYEDRHYTDVQPKGTIDQKISDQVLKLDPSFTLDGFVNGACRAYEIILKAFSEGDRFELRKLLSDELFSEFDRVIKEREKKGYSQKLAELNINSVLVEDVNVIENKIYVKLIFTASMVIDISEQTESFEQKTTSKSEEMHDVWTFARDPQSKDMNWILVETDQE